jgi:short subunit dehydrogenase-like uncharacterized protein
MAGRIVVFGATGYTGRLTAEALVRRGAHPVLAGRSGDKLAALSAELGGLEQVVADAARPETVAALVECRDVLVSTVGPFARFGQPALQAAISARASYLDSTGEPPFVRQVFERYGPVAQRTGAGLVTAFGYDYVPGNLAGALALRDAGPDAERIDVGYFYTGSGGRGDVSGGTAASLAGIALDQSFSWRGSRIVSERAARRVRGFPVDGKDRKAISIGASEHFALPRLAPRLREVNAYIGWFGPLSRGLQGASTASELVTRIPGSRAAAGALTGRFLRGSTGGPDADRRARTGSHAIAVAYGREDRPLAEVHVAGPNAYTFTAEILAWGATRAAERGLESSGALGPVDAFGLEALEAGCAEVGLRRV